MENTGNQEKIQQLGDLNARVGEEKITKFFEKVG